MRGQRNPSTEDLKKLLQEWEDDWPSRDEIIEKLREKGFSVTSVSLRIQLRSIARSDIFKDHHYYDERLRLRILRALWLSEEAKAVLLAIKDGFRAPPEIAARANELLKAKYFGKGRRILSREIKGYLSPLKHLAKVDREVRVILRKLK